MSTRPAVVVAQQASAFPRIARFREIDAKSRTCLETRADRNPVTEGLVEVFYIST
jgi:hypothetical protein